MKGKRGRKPKSIKMPKQETMVKPFENFNDIIEYLTDNSDVIETAAQFEFIRNCIPDDMWYEIANNIRDKVEEDKVDHEDANVYEDQEEW